MGLARIADTSWLYAIFDADDAFHDEAIAALHIPQVTIVPLAIMNETLDLIKYRGGKEAALAARKSLESFPHFDLWYHVDGGEAAWVWEQESGLSIHDAHAVALARRTGFELLTFDKQQAGATKGEVAPGSHRARIIH